MDEGELFDRNGDPHEMQNLFQDGAHSTKKSNLMEGMVREMIRLGDTAPYATHIA